MMIQFGEILKELRKSKGKTQEEIAEIFGVSGQSVSRWELGACYPDIELLPAIANYFDVTVDRLLSNDVSSKEIDRKIYLEKREAIPFGSYDRVVLCWEYCSKYPEDEFYAWNFVNNCADYIRGIDTSDEKYKKYMPLLRKTARMLLDTKYRNAAIERMATVCEESELDEWLDLCPWCSVGFSRRGVLVCRAESGEDNYIQQGLESLESFAAQLDRRFPDVLGAKRKAEYQADVLRVIRSFGDNGDVPDGWKLFYAYKQLVLAACLFGKKDYDAGWREFDSAVEKYKYIFSLDDEWLDIGGSIFAGLKISKDWRFAIDGRGIKHELFGINHLSFYDAEFLYCFLTDSRWAWFNSVRETEKYQAFLKWAKDMSDTQNKE